MATPIRPLGPGSSAFVSQTLSAGGTPFRFRAMNALAGHTRPWFRHAGIPMALAVLLMAAAANAFAQAADPSRMDGRRFGVVYDVPATREVKLVANVPYWKDASGTLACDVFLPPRMKAGEKLPVVVFLNAIGDR